ncbi:MAG TPA: sensor histidine kinase [Streptosporangiaceae bacterium]|nr:sensor histidine kinase [Streptosporangiaceae bacterium]
MLRTLAGPEDVDDARLSHYRRLAIAVIILFVLLSPAIQVFANHTVPIGERWFLLAGSVVFVIIADAFAIAPASPWIRPAPWAAITPIIALAVALFAVGGTNWLAVLAVAAGASGRFSQTRWPAVFSSAACAGAGFGVAFTSDVGFGGTLAATVIGPIVAFLAYGAGRRVEAVSALRRARADLARTAVAEERLRIARDLHDLLGHSLSLITLKAELASRVIATDPDRAAAEITELESVARQSLSDVRAAVAGYRQPDLAAELDSAKQLLDSAGIASDITAANAGGLPHAVDAALAWAVREGTTNVVRHSKATHVAISVSTGPATVTAEITDNGPPADDGPPRPRLGQDAVPSDGGGRIRLGGSGLAGLAERIQGLGGELLAGAVAPRGFRLRVVVPLGSQP